MNELPLHAASLRLRRPPGRPRRLATMAGPGLPIQRAPLEAAPEAAMLRHFAPIVPPRGLPLPAASAYSGLPVRALWRLIAAGRLHPIKLAGVRRLIIDRRDLDLLLDENKAPGGGG